MHADPCAIAQPLGAALGSLVHWPFDALRLQHAQAVQAGLVRKSLLESRDFEHGLAALERLALGPLARHN